MLWIRITFLGEHHQAWRGFGLWADQRGAGGVAKVAILNEWHQA